MDVVALLTAFADQGVPMWALLSVLALVGYWFFYREMSQGARADRKQLDSRTQAFIDDIQEQLERERQYGREAAKCLDQLALDLAHVKGQNEVLSTHIKMFISCHKPDCPFRDVRKTLT